MGKIIRTAGQLALCLALNQTPAIEHDNIIHEYKRIYERSYIWTAEKDVIDHRSYPHNLNSCEIKA